MNLIKGKSKNIITQFKNNYTTLKNIKKINEEQNKLLGSVVGKPLRSY